MKSLLILTLTTLGFAATGSVNAQNAILAEMYGRGVHAHYSGNSSDAKQLLSSAIDNGSKDPRTYYFRGIVAFGEGRAYEAESDWRRGAELEASGNANPSIGRSLARFQGSGRMKLEQIRQKARLQALSMQASRSQQRYGEIQSSGIGSGPVTTPPASKAAAPPVPSVVPPPALPVENPFADDSLAKGEPKVDADDALEGAMDNPFADEPAAASGDAPATNDPFAEKSPASDPFGGGDSAAADPFGGDAGASMDDDPFGN